MSLDRAGRDPRPGLAATIQQLLQGAAEIGRTRLELARLELEAEGRRLARALLRLAAGLFLLLFALALAVTGWLLYLPAQERVVWALVLALAFAVAAALLVWDGRRLARRRRPLPCTRWMPPR